MRWPESDEVRRILAVRLDNIGDMVMLSPALASLEDAFPGAEITLLATKAGASVAPMLPGRPRVIVTRPIWQELGDAGGFDPAGDLALAEELRERAFDAAFIFTSFSQSALPPAYLCYLAGIPLRAGATREFAGGVLTHPVRPLPHEAHQADRNLHLLEAVGLPVRPARFELELPLAAEVRATRLLAAAGVRPGAGYVVLAPGASCSARRYSAERFAVAGARISRASGRPVVVVGGERDEAMAETVARTIGASGASLAGKTSVPELAAVIAGAELVVTNNSGPLHLADAFGVPVVVLYAGTDLESQWRPRNVPSVALRRETACTPCYALDCPFDAACLDIPATEVASAALGLLQPRRSRAEAEVLTA